MTFEAKRAIWIAGGATTVLLLASLALLPTYPDGNRGPLNEVWKRENQIQLAIKLYAVDHEGRTPHSLDALVPDYLDRHAADKLFDGIVFLKPNAVFNDLPAKSILLQQAHPDKKGRIAAVTADRTGLAISQ